MTVPENEITKADLIAQSIDFTEQFNESVATLLKIMGVSRMTPMTAGSQIKIYKSEVTKADGKPAEGDVIPLSKVTRKLSKTEELTFSKYRKQVTAEAIQGAGFTPAVADTDNKLLKEIQKDIKKSFVDFVMTGTTTATGTNFQTALANALGQLAVKWEDDDVQSVLFVNPIDFYAYLGSANVTVQTAFGLQYVQNFLGFNTIIMTGLVPQGKVAATASQNINYAYAAMSGSLGQAFNLTTDETGLIGIVHDAKTENASVETMAMTASVVYPERLDGIVVATISAPSASSGK